MAYGTFLEVIVGVDKANNWPVVVLRESIHKYVKFYNTVRLHKYLNYKTPEQVEGAFWKILK